jgi:hypothetical protein
MPARASKLAETTSRYPRLNRLLCSSSCVFYSGGPRSRAAPAAPTPGKDEKGDTSSGNTARGRRLARDKALPHKAMGAGGRRFPGPSGLARLRRHVCRLGDARREPSEEACPEGRRYVPASRSLLRYCRVLQPLLADHQDQAVRFAEDLGGEAGSEDAHEPRRRLPPVTIRPAPISRPSLTTSRSGFPSL